MKQIISILFFITIISCSNFNNKKEKVTIDLNSCRIEKKFDKSIVSTSNVTQLDFFCGNTLVSSYNFFDNNPYKEINFPIIEKSTKYYHVHKNYNELKRTGNIDFNLNDSSFSKVKSEIDHDLVDLTDYHFGIAITRCDYFVNFNKAVVTYYISINGSKDSLVNSGHQVFLGGNLVVINNLGEIEYNINRSNYAITDVIFDDSLSLLYFKTSKIINGKGVDGLKLIDLNKEQVVFQTEFDSTFIVHNPIYEGDTYALIKVKDYYDKLRFLYIIDFEESEVSVMKIDDKYKYSYPRVYNDNILLGVLQGNDPAGVLEYDTIKISNIKNAR